MLISKDRLTNLATAIVEAACEDGERAQIVASHLVSANLAGHDSHGVGMLPLYMRGLKEGKLNFTADAKVVKDAGPVLIVDGQMGFGQVIARQTMEMGIAKAKELGIAIVGLRDSFHIGRIGAWGEMCADAGLVSIHFVNALSPNSIVAPYGGSDARFTTNPYCTAIPKTDKTPRIVLDMATSAIAHGKARVAYLAGKEVPENTIIDSQGNPTTDPTVIFEEPLGALTSMGLHKGYGLALICDLLGGALTGGGAYNKENLASNRVVNNMLTIILDPAIFDTEEFFQSEIDRYSQWVKASPPAPGFDEVLFPGDPESRTKAEREANGLPIDNGTWEQLLETADLVGLGRDEALRIAGN